MSKTVDTEEVTGHIFKIPETTYSEEQEKLQDKLPDPGSSVMELLTWMNRQNKPKQRSRRR